MSTVIGELDLIPYIQCCSGKTWTLWGQWSRLNFQIQTNVTFHKEVKFEGISFSCIFQGRSQDVEESTQIHPFRALFTFTLTNKFLHNSDNFELSLRSWYSFTFVLPILHRIFLISREHLSTNLLVISMVTEPLYATFSCFGGCGIQTTAIGWSKGTD